MAIGLTFAGRTPTAPFGGCISINPGSPPPDVGPVTLKGIRNDGTLTLTNCTISGNFATSLGGGIINTTTTATLRLTNSTVSGNTAHAGGGIYNFFGPVTLTNSTVSGNIGSYVSGGIKNFGSTVLLRSTIIPGNGRAHPDDIRGDQVDSASSFNLIGTGGSGGLVNGVNHNIVGVRNPGLGPLGDNGRPTQTQALLPSSPAIDQGLSFGSTTDQRGLPRPYDDPRIPNAQGSDGSDIGAFEKQP